MRFFAINLLLSFYGARMDNFSADPFSAGPDPELIHDHAGVPDIGNLIVIITISFL